MKVYIVRFSCDEYSDYYDRPVSAWIDINKAKAEKAVLNWKLKRARKAYKQKYNDRIPSSYKEALDEARKILPEFESEQNEYFIEETELYGVEE